MLKGDSGGIDMIQIVKDTRPWFFLQTTHSTYGMRVMETGHLEHLYYGERITVDTQDPSSCAPLVIQRAFAPGNTCIYTKEQPQISMEDVCLEVGTCGKGDIREPFLEVCFTDGSVTSDFTFVSFEVLTLKDRDERMQASGASSQLFGRGKFLGKMPSYYFAGCYKSFGTAAVLYRV